MGDERAGRPHESAPAKRGQGRACTRAVQHWHGKDTRSACMRGDGGVSPLAPGPAAARRHGRARRTQHTHSPTDSLADRQHRVADDVGALQQLRLGDRQRRREANDVAVRRLCKEPALRQAQAHVVRVGRRRRRNHDRVQQALAADLVVLWVCMCVCVRERERGRLGVGAVMIALSRPLLWTGLTGVFVVVVCACVGGSSSHTHTCTHTCTDARTRTAHTHASTPTTHRRHALGRDGREPRAQERAQALGVVREALLDEDLQRRGRAHVGPMWCT